MAAQVFRKVALDRLSSPEQLDQLVRVAPPQGWAALGILTGLLTAALLWGWFGAVSVEVSGEGVLQPQASSSVSNAAPGTMEAVLLVPLNEDHKIVPGLEVHLFPENGNNRQEEFVAGDVRNVELVTRKDARFALVSVKVREDQGAGAATSTLYSFTTGLPSAGSTRVSGRIIIRSERPLQLLVPMLRGSELR